MDVNAATVNYETFSVFQGYNKVDKRLVITTCANQDPLQATTGNNISLLNPSEGFLGASQSYCVCILTRNLFRTWHSLHSIGYFSPHLSASFVVTVINMSISVC